MTIGEKITKLRMAKGMSQEELADELRISRQSVSKWEMDQAIPQIDKVLVLCEFFGVSADELLRDKISINFGSERTKNKSRVTDFKKHL